ncbi:MAG TPA: anthrone oxygenase family protein [Terriglobia bacterium]|nr:anthrone oxygenase family protein [Terriglobia bacterium]
MTLNTVFLWLYSGMASLVFGATVYETLVVHPAWSRKPPESFVAFMGTPVGRMNLAAFWIPVAPLFALSAVASVAVAAIKGTPNLILIASAACAVIAVAWTLTYFRPTIAHFLERQGDNAPAERLQAEARRWIVLNWIRLALVTASWFGVFAASHS